MTSDTDYTEDSALFCLYNNKEGKETPETPPQLHITYTKKSLPVGYICFREY